MIKRYSEWERINEVDELTEVVLVGKYIDKIVEAYRKYPSSRPCREMEKFPNAKGFKPLADFVKERSGKTSAEILIDVIDEWYQWPQGKSRDVLVTYIKNEDDLSNLGAWGIPFGKVLQADPVLAANIGGLGRGVVKGITRGAKNLWKMVPKLFENNQPRALNEAAPLVAVGAFILKAAAGVLLSGGVKYSLYGKESLQDDILVSWMTPFLPGIRGLVGDDPVISTYVTTFNAMMMLIYDAWNLSMGQDKYGKENNPILSWQNSQSSDNYIKSYYSDFYESDPDIKKNFTNFMSSLKSACMEDMKNPEKFNECPFYYTGEKIRVTFEDERVENISVSEWQKWVRDNYTKYKLVPVEGSSSEFRAQERKKPFSPLSPFGIEETPKGDPMRDVTLQFPDGSTIKLSLF